MEGKVTPTAFYGSAIAALSGLLLGLLLHAPWQDHSNGPQILFSSAAAAELARPANADDGQALSADDPQAAANSQYASLDGAYNDPGYIPPDPLPVTRLAPGRFGSDETEVQPASAGSAELPMDGDGDVVAAAASEGGGEDAAGAVRAPAVSGFN